MMNCGRIFVDKICGATHLRIAAIAISAIVLFTLLSVVRWDRHRKYPPRLVRHITETVRQAARLGTFAEQDSDPLAALLHSTTALAQIRLARGVMGDIDVRTSVGCNPEELEFVLADLQAKSMQRLATNGIQMHSEAGIGPATGWQGPQ